MRRSDRELTLTDLTSLNSRELESLPAETNADKSTEADTIDRNGPDILQESNLTRAELEALEIAEDERLDKLYGANQNLITRDTLYTKKGEKPKCFALTPTLFCNGHDFHSIIPSRSDLGGGESTEEMILNESDDELEITDQTNSDMLPDNPKKPYLDDVYRRR